MLKSVVIGGGIAGLAFAIALKKSGKDVVLKTKYAVLGAEGMAYLINSCTLDKIRELAITPSQLEGYPIQQFLMLDNFGSVQSDVPLNSWYSIKRFELIKFLADQLDYSIMHEHCDFSHFLFEGEKAVAAVFSDGSIEYGDLFIGADGINSKVRQHVSATSFYPNLINEIVCMVDNDVLPEYKNTFRKYLSKNNGLSFGYIPLNEKQHVCFCQFSSGLIEGELTNDSASNKLISEQLLNDFPQEVKQIVSKIEFERSHLWQSHELQLLDRYYKGNICLIGDAATGSISLTSAGVSGAVASATELAQVLNSSETVEQALDQYNTVRKNAHINLIEYASTLKHQFLKGIGEMDKNEFRLPFMK